MGTKPLDADMVWAGLGTEETANDGVMIVQEKGGQRNVIIGTGSYAFTVTADCARELAAAITEKVDQRAAVEQRLRALWTADGSRESFEDYVGMQRMGSWGERGELAHKVELPGDDEIIVPEKGDPSPCGDCGEDYCDPCNYKKELAVAANPCKSCKGTGLGEKED